MRTRWGWAWSLLLGLAACSPSLNWRTVPVEQLAALLPCKPDHAVRTVDLGGAQQTLSMWGCEAGGALFAISHLHVGSAASSQPMIAAWQQAALRNISGSTAQTLPFQAPALAGQTPALGTMVRTSGKRADGQVVQAQWAWISQGADVYHLAVYAPALTPSMTETFFTELRWQ